MKHINFLIITESYVYKTGLRFLLEEMPVTGRIFFSDDLSQAGKSNADYIFIDTGLLDRIETGTLPLPGDGDEEEWPVFIALTPRGQDARHQYPGLFRYSLDLSRPKSELLQFLDEITRNSIPHNKNAGREEKLSEREKTILRYVALGHTNREIAGKLFISMHTVVTHRKNITRKLGIKTVSGLTVYAILNHLIDMDEAG